MSIANTYSDLIIEQIIRQILDEGTALSIAEINKRYTAFIGSNDLSSPLFNVQEANVNDNESFSVDKDNETNLEIARDLTVLYQELLKITDNSIRSFDRWRTQTNSMRAQIRALDTRINNLLATQSINAHYISEDFVDTSKIDLANTTAFVNLNEHSVYLNTASANPTRLNLNNITSNDVEFTVLSRNNLKSVATVTPIVNAFDDINNFWLTKILTTSDKEVISAELKANISATSITKITITLHSSDSGSATQITPMISIDGVNFQPLNVSNPIISIDTVGTWSFPSTDITVIKFIMNKTGYDTLEDNNFVYEFGAQDISFYSETFTENNIDYLYSNVLSALDLDNNPIEFNSVQLQVCERIPQNTNIDYFISALNNPNDNPVWIAIDQINKDPSLHPKQINFGNIDKLILNGLKVSYDASGSTNLINPGSKFNLISFVSGEQITTHMTADNSRYIVPNSNDRILDTEVDASLDIDSIEIFRNVGEKGNTDLVRNIQRGWTFIDPYYISNIEVNNQNGFIVDFGDQSVILDNLPAKGRTTISTGVHNIKVHKNNWINIPLNLATIDDLKLSDPLFPFNQKYLIEGYNLNTPENPYIGMDTFAGYYMTEVSIYDLSYNIPADDYSKFAVDTDAAISNINKPISTIFVVKSNENFSDFLDEQFKVRFNVNNQLYKYLKFKAQLSTQDITVTPNLDGYKIKIGN